MLRIKSFYIAMLAFGITGCEQLYSNHTHKKIIVMETEKFTNNTVKAAYDAWQKGNSMLWLSLFTEDATLLDDGHSRNFQKFSTKTIGHERFTSIDKIEDNGLSIYGKFHSNIWGNFKTYFKFHINNEGKIYQLEIGKADY